MWFGLFIPMLVGLALTFAPILRRIWQGLSLAAYLRMLAVLLAGGGGGPPPDRASLTVAYVLVLGIVGPLLARLGDLARGVRQCERAITAHESLLRAFRRRRARTPSPRPRR